MYKMFCDACKKEVKSLDKFKYLCHIEDLALGDCATGYVDIDDNMVSGREDSKDLCHSCYNRVLTKAYQEMVEIQNENITGN